MYEKKQNFIKLFLKIVTPIILLVAISSYFFLKKIEDEKKNLMYEKVQSMASLIHSIYNFDAKYSLKTEFEFNSSRATLEQVQETFNQLNNHQGINLTYFLGTVENGYIEFLAYSTSDKPEKINILDIEKAQSMRDALEGYSAVQVKQDFSGEKVFSAFTNIEGTPWALVIEQSYCDHIEPFKEIALSVAFLSMIVLVILFFVLEYFEKKNSLLIKSSEDRFRHMVESTSDLVWEIDSNARFTYLSNQMETLLGYSYEECLGKTPFDFMPEREALRVQEIFQNLLKTKGCIVDIESISIRKNKEEVSVLTNGTPFYNSLGDLIGYRGISKDITESKKYRQELNKLAYFDTLTGLANRKNILSRVEEEIQYSLRNSTYSAVIYLDLDGFKYINDTLGHNNGDEVLKIVACKLKESVREFDVVGRVGGDEFVILVKGQEKDLTLFEEQLLLLQERLNKSINKMMFLEGQEYSVGASIGIVLIPRDAQSASQAIKNADSAMYKAKALGKNCTVFYDTTLQKEVEESNHLKAEILDALEKEEFEVYYQPQYATSAIKIVGYEGLIRWIHPLRGVLEASVFMADIVRFGLYLELDKYVCNKVCKDLSSELINTTDLNISINLSAKSFEDDALVVFFEEKIFRDGINTSKITLEITEDALLQIVSNSYIKRLISLGFKISIDDFGTGCSSLSCLSMLEYHEVKLDKSFVQNITRTKKDKELCQSILHICKVLAVKIVASGVETQEQLNFLKNEGVDVIQGYIYAKAAPLENILSK